MEGFWRSFGHKNWNKLPLESGPSNVNFIFQMRMCNFVKRRPMCSRIVGIALHTSHLLILENIQFQMINSNYI